MKCHFFGCGGHLYSTFGKILHGGDRAVPISRFGKMVIITPYADMHRIRLFAWHVWIVLLQNSAEQGVWVVVSNTVSIQQVLNVDTSRGK